MEAIRSINLCIAAAFLLCYFYQYIYMFIPFVIKDKAHKPVRMHRYAVLIAARNEAAVIGGLVDSIKGQDYPAHLIDTYVVADNCTDGTARIAALHGAVVYERWNEQQCGKGYALGWLLDALKNEGRIGRYDAFFVFDADNLLSPDYISCMNRTFSDGYKIVTSCRASKNFADNWLSAAYGIWFLRQSEFLNHARMLLGVGCAVSGTGFLVSRCVLEACGGWPFCLLTEDLEFTVHTALMGYKCGYCKDAVFYDEQPTCLSQSWKQRLRWSRGYFQVFCRYWRPLLRGVFFEHSFTCYDLIMNVAPAVILSAVSIVLNAAMMLYSAVAGLPVLPTVLSVLKSLCGVWCVMFIISAATVIRQRHLIHCPSGRLCLYSFMFPLYMLLSIPVAATALVRDVRWQPIEHNRAITINEVLGTSSRS